MDKSRQKFAQRLIAALQAAGYEPKPAILEREFNQRHFGKPMSLHGVRRWLLGEVIPTFDKIETLSTWLNVTPQELGFGPEIEKRLQDKRKRWDEGIGYQEREVFDAFLKLPAPQRKVVREVILAFARAHAPGGKP